MFIITPLKNAASNVFVVAWDLALTGVNLVSPSRPEGHVVPAGHPGAGGIWPEYMSPDGDDSRCSCPALNALANHGILPRNGRNISFKDMNATVRAAYNFAPSFCYFVPNFAANMLHKNYDTDTFDLEELDLYNGIQHDASLTREDSALVPNQGKPHQPFIKELISSASGKDKEGNVLLTAKDLSRFSAKRRVEARETNTQFSLDFFHKMFGSANSSTLLAIFGGRQKDLETFLTEEKLPEGWEPRVRKPMGLTISAFNFTVLGVERGIDEKKFIAERAAAHDSAL